MQLKNTKKSWGLIAITMHWIIALTVFAMFGVGLWMVDLNYYHDWYRTAPFMHKSTGILLFILMLGRLGWRMVNVTPNALPTHKRWEKKLAHLVHIILYIVLFCVMISGYLISTADGRAISVFGWFEVPALMQGIEHQEDIAGEIHVILAFVLIGLAVMHAGAALKHHFIDKDETLKRMVGSKATS